jgi:hypothetical protein
MLGRYPFVEPSRCRCAQILPHWCWLIALGATQLQQKHSSIRQSFDTAPARLEDVHRNRFSAKPSSYEAECYEATVKVCAGL